ncbi:bestrophin family protein [Fibrella aquatica]|uniref:bestrophin family protein n=1 Tax=Fibrella aquatica TaxID=3242487 RepID=UPI0035203E42
MYTRKRISFRHLWSFTWRPILFFVTYSTAIVSLYIATDWPLLTVPFIPIATIGTAVAFYVGFKNNSAYDRLWEGRRVWGSLTNASRSWAIMVLDYITNLNASGQLPASELRNHHRLLIYRHLAFLNALRLQLRSKHVWEEHHGAELKIIDHIEAFQQKKMDYELCHFLPKDEVNSLLSKANVATQLIRNQSAHLRELRALGLLSDIYHNELERMLVELYNQQGAAERLKTFPFPRQYAFFSYVFVWLFILLLPFGLITEMTKVGGWHVWLTIPFYTLIAWVFNTMEVVGDTSENPFENSINDVPISAICRNIEIDLREMLSETELPAKLQAVDNILM